MQPAAPTPDSTDPDIETEWEYELHPTEKQTYYITLDTSTLNPPTPSKAGRSPAAKPRKPASKLTPGANVNTTRPADSSTTAQSTEPKETIQILDLHSANPLIKYKDSLYSCTWTTDQGSQFFVSTPGTVPGPLRKGRAVDVVGLSRVRLLGREAKVKLKSRSGAESRNGGATVGNAGDVATQAAHIGREGQSVNVVGGEERHAGDRELEGHEGSTTMLEGDRKRRRREFLNALGLPLDGSVARQRYTPRQPPAPHESEPRHDADDYGAESGLTTGGPTQETNAPVALAEMPSAHADPAQETSGRTEDPEEEIVAHAAEGPSTGGTGSLQPGAAAAEADPPPAKKRRKPGPKSAAQIRAEVGLRK